MYFNGFVGVYISLAVVIQQLVLLGRLNILVRFLLFGMSLILYSILGFHVHVFTKYFVYGAIEYF